MKNGAKVRRNEEIYFKRKCMGKMFKELAAEYEISTTRVRQIVNEYELEYFRKLSTLSKNVVITKQERK